MASKSPTKFGREVVNEGKKVTWPDRRETLITTAMVFVMVAIMAIFLFLGDQTISWLVRLILGL